MTSVRASAGPLPRGLLGWTIAAALGGFMVGYELAVISGALLFLRHDFALGGFEQGALVSVVPLGAMAGGLLVGRVSDALGRRTTLLLAAALFMAATVVAVAAASFGVLLAARALTGIAVGANSSTVPVYLSEIAPPEVRGRLVTVNQLMVTAGIVTAYCVGLIFADSESWRAMFATGLLPSTLMLVGMLRAPETPAWLQAQGRSDEAEKVLRDVIDEPSAERVLEDFRRLNRQSARALGLRALLRSAAAPALLVAIALAAMQQFSGINAIIPYAPTIMERAGLTASNSLVSSVLIGLANVAATMVALSLVDRRGRRPLLLASAAGTGAALVLLGITFEVSLSGLGSWLPLVFLLAYIAFFAIGLGPIFWLLIAEIFPPDARATGAGVATAVNWFSGFVVGLIFVPLSDAIGTSGVFWGFAGVCAVTIVFVRRYVPETKGRTFAEIADDVRARLAGDGQLRHAERGAPSARAR
jgi:sugar porter (SP) family MFS transporter